LPWMRPPEVLEEWSAFGLQGVDGGEAPFFIVYGLIALVLAAWALMGRLGVVAGSAVALSGVAGFHLSSLKNSADNVVQSTIEDLMPGAVATIGVGLFVTMAGTGFVVLAWILAFARGGLSPTPPRPDLPLPH
jgi:hypothetical protein